LNIITTFEKIIFSRIDNAYGEIKKIVSEEYRRRYLKKQFAPLHHSVNSFIKNKNDFYSLSGAKKVLKNPISEELFQDLTEIIEYRNYLSHGKRQDVGTASTFKIGEIKDILINIIELIE
jgi:hypothetical protein